MNTYKTYMLVDINGKIRAVAFEPSFEHAIDTFRLFEPNLSKSHLSEFILTDFEAMELYNWRKEVDQVLTETEEI